MSKEKKPLDSGYDNAGWRNLLRLAALPKVSLDTGPKGKDPVVAVFKKTWELGTVKKFFRNLIWRVRF